MRLITIYAVQNNIPTIMGINQGITHVKRVNQGREDIWNLDNNHVGVFIIGVVCGKRVLIMQCL